MCGCKALNYSPKMQTFVGLTSLKAKCDLVRSLTRFNLVKMKLALAALTLFLIPGCTTEQSKQFLDVFAKSPLFVQSSSGCAPQKGDPVYVGDDGKHVTAASVHILEGTVMCQQEGYIKVYLRANSARDHEVMSSFLDNRYCKLADESDRVEIEDWAKSKEPEDNVYIRLPKQPNYEPRSFWVRRDAFTCG